MNSLNDSGDFQDVESTYCGRLSHVSSQPVMIPSSRSMLSRDKRLPLDTWNQSGVQENVLGNQFSTFDSPRNHPQKKSICAKKPGSSHTSEDRLNPGTIPMPTFATMLVELPKNSTVGQQRQQMS